MIEPSGPSTPPSTRPNPEGFEEEQPGLAATAMIARTAKVAVPARAMWETLIQTSGCRAATVRSQKLLRNLSMRSPIAQGNRTAASQDGFLRQEWTYG